jgi:hypothetical protein
MTDRPLSAPTGSVQDISIIRRMMVKRHREQQPALNYPDQDTIDGADSSDE